MAGMGTAIWLMARLCRTTLRHPLLLIAARRFGISVSSWASAEFSLGDSTGYEWLEFPPYSAITLFVAYLLIMSWAMLMFRFRRRGHDLHHAMVFARRVPLVPVALRRDANHAFRCSGAGRDAGRGELVVCE